MSIVSLATTLVVCWQFKFLEPTPVPAFVEPQRRSCEGLGNCHVYAQCVYDERIHDSTCKCLDGYVGDGFQNCVPEGEFNNSR